MAWPIIFSIILACAESVCAILFMGVFSNQRTFRHERKTPLCLPMVLYAIIASLPMPLISNTLFKVALLSAICLLVFNVHILKCVFLSAVCYSLLMSLDNAATLIPAYVMNLSLQETYQNPINSFTALLFSRAILFGIVLLLHVKWPDMKNQEVTLGLADGAMMVYFPLVTIVVFANLSGYMEAAKRIPLLLIAAIIGILLMNFILFLLIERMAHRSRIAYENRMLKEQVKMELNGIYSLMEANRENRAFMHDFDKHIIGLQGMIKAGETEAALEYTERLIGSDAHSIYRFSTGNTIIDAILGQKDMLAKSKGVTLDCRLENLAGVQMNEEDIVVLLGNLLDNAIEATCQTTGSAKVVKIKINYADKQLLISVVNPTSHNVEIVDGHTIKTSKTEKTFHGYGLHNALQVIAKYGGTQVMDSVVGFFQFTAAIPQLQGVQ